jgi:phage terminase small subunit
MTDIRKPRYLRGRGAKIWRELLPECVALGTVTPADSRLFAVFCHLLGQFEMRPFADNGSLITQIRHLGMSFGVAGAGSRKPTPRKESNHDA